MSLREYWLFMLFNALFFLAFSFVLSLFSGAFIVQALFKMMSGGAIDFTLPVIISNMFNPLTSLLFFLPLLVATARRLTDAGYSRWFMVLFVLPLLGWIALAVLLLAKSYDDVSRCAAPQNSKSAVSFCHRCGASVDSEDNAFCTSCGIQLRRE